MNKTIGVNDGHTISGPGSGAVGRISESQHTRLVGNEVRNLFKENGQNVVDCTIDYSSSTNENLNLIVQQANRQELDWFISIHFNAGGGRGVEVYTYEGRQYQDALNVCSNISKVLGITNRGVKAGTGLYVIRKTKAKSMLIEVCFVDNDDADKYLSKGHKEVAKAIVEGILGYIREVVPNKVEGDTFINGSEKSHIYADTGLNIEVGYLVPGQKVNSLGVVPGRCRVTFELPNKDWLIGYVRL